MNQEPTDSAQAESSPEVLYEADGHIAIITLNRPVRMNTISIPMLAQLSDALLKAEDDPEIRAIVRTGAGRVFCAGLDLTRATEGSVRIEGSPNTVTLDLKRAPPTVLFNMDKPVICALNGSAAGYGMDTALGCDIRVMSETGKMAAAFTKRGILPESGGTWYLPRLLGWSRAAELIFTGRTLSATECLALGLVSEMAPADQVSARARAIAAEIAEGAPLAVQASKRMMRSGLTESFNDHVHHVFLQLLPLTQTNDALEGMRAFMENARLSSRGAEPFLFQPRTR